MNIRLNDVSDEGKHGNTAVFDFRVAKEANGLLIVGRPEIGIC